MAQRAPQNPAPSLKALDDTYEIIGELRGSETARQHVGRRRSDGADVVITVAVPPKGDGNNELSHYAADVKLRAELSYPHVVPVIEARWVGRDALAVVSERVKGTSLDDQLDHEERFSNPRIAAVLQEVLGVLDWARDRGVVHRGVTPDGLIFEEGTEQVFVALGLTSIPITGVADAAADARTIGRLAWSMLTGQRYTPESEKRLTELAPDLAVRVVEATQKLLGAKDGAAPPDVANILGIIAAGDAFKQAEVELAAMKEQYDEEHRIAIAKCEHDRRQSEQQAAEAAAALAQQRAEWEQRVRETETRLSDARADFDRIMTERQEQLATIRATLEKQAADLEKRLADFDARRANFERMVLERQKEEAETPSLEELALATKEPEGWSPSPKEIRRAFAPLDADPTAAPGEESLWRKYRVPAGVAALVIALGAAIAGVRHFSDTPAANTITLGKSTITPTAPAIENRALSRGGFMSQSAGGALSPRVFGAPVPSAAKAAPVDSTATTAAVVDTVTPVEAPKPRPRPQRTPDPEYQVAPPSRLFDLPRRDTSAKRDSIRRDSLQRDSVRIRPDTVVDTLATVRRR